MTKASLQQGVLAVTGPVHAVAAARKVAIPVKGG